jgi:hypothetical protein
MKTMPKCLLALSSLALCACANQKGHSSIPDSSELASSLEASSFSSAPASSSSSSSSGLASSSNSSSASIETTYENVDDVFAQEQRIDIDGDYAAQEAEDLSAISNVIDLSALGEGETKTITDGGTYLVKGSAANASIEINSEGEVKLILADASLTCASGVPLKVSAASSFTLSIASKTKNYLSETVSNDDAVILVDNGEKLNIEGEGYLYISSGEGLDGAVGAGIKSPKGVSIEGTHLTINASGHSINAKKGVEVNDAKICLTSGKDGIHAEKGEVSIKGSVFDSSSYGDGIDAGAEVTIEDSTTHFETTGTYVLYVASEDSTGELYEDSRYIKSNGDYKKIDSDSMDRYSERYYLVDKCKGVKSEGAVSFKGGAHYFKTADDCLASDVSVTISSGDYSFYTADQAINSDQALSIGNDDSEELDIRIYHSFEGIQGGAIDFYSGYTYIYAEDDGINATSDTDGFDVSMNFHDGATVYVNAEGDGVDSNGDITMDGGNLVVAGPSSGGNGSLDFDGSFSFTGGNLIAVGSNSMAQVPDTSGVNALSYGTSGWSKGARYSLYCGDYEFSVTLPKNLSSVSFIVQSPSLVSGEKVSVVKGSTLKADSRNGAYIGKRASEGGSTLIESTLSEGLTTIGTTSNHPGGGRGPGGR